jgi:hypothetical protein
VAGQLEDCREAEGGCHPSDRPQGRYGNIPFQHVWWHPILKAPLLLQPAEPCPVSSHIMIAGSLFAMCPVKDGAVERTVDSSRYYVFKIQNAQGAALLISGLNMHGSRLTWTYSLCLQAGMPSSAWRSTSEKRPSTSTWHCRSMRSTCTC